MLFIVIIIVALAVAAHIRNLDQDARFNYGRDIAEFLDLNSMFETAYLGGFGFDEALPNEDLRERTESQFDKGVESRLAFHFVRTLPKWVLKSAAADVKTGQFNNQASYAPHINNQIDQFAKARSSQLSDLLKQAADPKPRTDTRRRRRR